MNSELKQIIQSMWNTDPINRPTCQCAYDTINHIYQNMLETVTKEELTNLDNISINNSIASSTNTNTNINRNSDNSFK